MEGTVHWNIRGSTYILLCRSTITFSYLLANLFNTFYETEMQEEDFRFRQNDQNVSVGKNPDYNSEMKGTLICGLPHLWLFYHAKIAKTLSFI